MVVLPEAVPPEGVPHAGEPSEEASAAAELPEAELPEVAGPSAAAGRRPRTARERRPGGTEVRTAVRPDRSVRPGCRPDCPDRVAPAAPPVLDAAPAVPLAPPAPAAQAWPAASSGQRSEARVSPPTGCTSQGLHKPVRSSPLPRNRHRNRARRSLRHPPRAPSTAQHCSQTDTRHGMRTGIGPYRPGCVSPSAAGSRAGLPRAASAPRRRTGGRVVRTTA